MKIILKNIKSIKQNTDNKLTKDVCNYVIEEWSDYEDKKSIFLDVINYGCVSGIVGKLIYYSDTIKYYKKFKEEINELLYDEMRNCGLYSFKDLFGCEFDDTDPLINEEHNQNLMAWFGFEETLRNIGYQFEELRDFI